MQKDGCLFNESKKESKNKSKNKITSWKLSKNRSNGFVTKTKNFNYFFAKSVFVFN